MPSSTNQNIASPKLYIEKLNKYRTVKMKLNIKAFIFLSLFLVATISYIVLNRHFRSCDYAEKVYSNGLKSSSAKNDYVYLNLHKVCKSQKVNALRKNGLFSEIEELKNCQSQRKIFCAVKYYRNNQIEASLEIVSRGVNLMSWMLYDGKNFKKSDPRALSNKLSSMEMLLVFIKDLDYRTLRYHKKIDQAKLRDIAYLNQYEQDSLKIFLMELGFYFEYKNRTIDTVYNSLKDIKIKERKRLQEDMMFAKKLNKMLVELTNEKQKLNQEKDNFNKKHQTNFI